jgi:hypothetical protein
MPAAPKVCFGECRNSRGLACVRCLKRSASRRTITLSVGTSVSPLFAGLILGLLVPGYNQVRQTVSEIGEVGSPWRDSLKGTGGTYHNQGVHIVRRRWRKIVEIDANEDSEAVANMLKR